MALPGDELVVIGGTVKRGYGVASGCGGDPRFPRGTIRLQVPHFRRRGLDLSDCHPGTINLDIAPRRFVPHRPDYRFESVRWSAEVPAETFSFPSCVISHGMRRVQGWVYYPHPETKPEHFHDASTVELLAPWLAGLHCGAPLTVEGSRAKIVLE